MELTVNLEVADALCCFSSGWGRGFAGTGERRLYGFFDGAADEIARAEADGQRECEDDASEENAEGEFDDDASDLKMVDCHRCGKHQHQPFDAEGQEACILQLCIDSTNENGAGEETRQQ